MMEELLAWLQRSEGPLAYCVLGGAALMEQLLPFLPGDSIAVFGIVMAVSAGYSAGGVYVALNAGALVGGLIAYSFGRWIGGHREARTPRFLRGQQIRATIDAALARFDAHGVAFLTVNRFVPAVRAVVFLAAGMARVEIWKVAFFGTLSAMAWNGVLMGLGWGLGANFETLEDWIATYTYVAIPIIVLVVGVMIWRARRARSGE